MFMLVLTFIELIYMITSLYFILFWMTDWIFTVIAKITLHAG